MARWLKYYKATLPLIFPLLPNFVGNNKGIGFGLKSHYKVAFCFAWSGVQPYSLSLFMAYSILSALVKYIFWFHQGLDTTHAFSVPADGQSSAVDAVTSKFGLSLSLTAPTTKAI